MQEYAKRIPGGIGCCLVLRSIYEENIYHIVKPCREIGQSLTFEESLRESKLVYNKLEIF